MDSSVFFCLTVCAFLAVSYAGPADQLDTIINNYWEWRLQEAPEFATKILIYRYNDKLESYNVTDFDRRHGEANNFLNQLEAIDRSSLPASRLSDFDVLKDQLKTFVDGYQFRFYGPLNPINFLEGVQQNTALFVSRTPFRNETDFVNFIARVNGYKTQVAEVIDRMKLAIEKNTTNHVVSMTRVQGQIDQILVDDPKQFVFYSPFTDTLDNMGSISASRKTQLRNEAEAAVQVFLDALREVRAFINTTYIPNCRPHWSISSVEGGNAAYRACLKWQLSVEMTPEDIHQKGLDEVERISGEMQKVMKRIKPGFSGSVKDFFDDLKRNSALYFQTGDEILAEYRRMHKERIKPKLSKLFENIPDIPLVIEALPTDGPTARYKDSAPDGSRPGTFQVNVVRPADSPKYTMMALALHESDPGHHMQDIYSATAHSLLPYRRFVDYTKYFAAPFHFPFYTAYGEGWGLYAEALGVEMGVYKDDYEMMGKYGSEIFRACRLVVDTGLHHYNWTRDRAVNYLLEYTPVSEAQINVEIDRYITWPGQACSYKIGELRIWDMRRKAEKELTCLFDIKAFHTVMLTNGNAPLSVLETLVDDWIRQVKSANGVTSDNDPCGACTLTHVYSIYVSMLWVIYKVCMWV